ncbi:hypothetical protein V1264_007497 [Littorina saxatilis]|uniref:Uncharacterized protein n=1 Tax=Littorina saxatilis TaxID=31220 RepID=A0AAN9AVG6_9CAEN
MDNLEALQLEDRNGISTPPESVYGTISQQKIPTNKQSPAAAGYSSIVRAFKRIEIGFISVMYVLGFAAFHVMLPVYAGSTKMAGGDSFIMIVYASLWFPVVFFIFTNLLQALSGNVVTWLPVGKWRAVIAVGVCYAATGLIISFAGLPERTPPYLQAVLSTLRLPFVIILRLLILRKGLSLRRFGCTIAVLVGIFITIAPQIWLLPGSGSESMNGGSIAHIIWPLIFAFGYLPAATFTVLLERELQQTETHSLSFITWTQVFLFVTMTLLFWVDFIPFFGMATSFEDFSQRLQRGIKCNFSSAGDCRGLTYKGWIFIMAYCFGNLFQVLLIEKAEGAVFVTVVLAIVTPLATIFWTFFKFDQDVDRFYFDPEFTETTAFTFGGLLIIVPSVILYNVFSHWDAEKKLERKPY